jgi:LAS superfamily LD-carboxypeptidase LdcB
MLGSEALTGRSRSHVVEIAEPQCVLHPDAAAAFLAMRVAAAAAGIDLAPSSSFRDVDRQLAIWNAKFRGERVLFNRSGQPLAFDSIAADELIDAILAWSALPGASRHHWGSDLDVIDGNALRAKRASDPQYQVQLLPQEFAPGAIFASLSAWLEANAGQFGFFRPYVEDLGGVMPEPWHLSYAPVSTAAQAEYEPQMLAQAISGADFAGKEAVLRRLPELVQRYVMTVSPPA